MEKFQKPSPLWKKNSQINVNIIFVIYSYF